MAEALNDSFDRPTVERIATMFGPVVDGFDSVAFVTDVMSTVDLDLGDFDAAGLTERARLVKRAPQRHLPDDPVAVMHAITASLSPPIADADELGGMDGFACPGLLA